MKKKKGDTFNLLDFGKIYPQVHQNTLPHSSVMPSPQANHPVASQYSHLVDIVYSGEMDSSSLTRNYGSQLGSTNHPLSIGNSVAQASANCSWSDVVARNEDVIHIPVKQNKVQNPASIPTTTPNSAPRSDMTSSSPLPTSPYSVTPPYPSLSNQESFSDQFFYNSKSVQMADTNTRVQYGDSNSHRSDAILPNPQNRTTYNHPNYYAYSPECMRGGKVPLQHEKPIYISYNNEMVCSRTASSGNIPSPPPLPAAKQNEMFLKVASQDYVNLNRPVYIQPLLPVQSTSTTGNDVSYTSSQEVETTESYHTETATNLQMQQESQTLPSPNTTVKIGCPGFEDKTQCISIHPVCKLYLMGQCTMEQNCNYLHLFAVPTRCHESYRMPWCDTSKPLPVIFPKLDVENCETITQTVETEIETEKVFEVPKANVTHSGPNLKHENQQPLSEPLIKLLRREVPTEPNYSAEVCEANTFKTSATPSDVKDSLSSAHSNVQYVSEISNERHTHMNSTLSPLEPQSPILHETPPTTSYRAQKFGKLNTVRKNRKQANQSFKQKTCDTSVASQTTINTPPAAVPLSNQDYNPALKPVTGLAAENQRAVGFEKINASMLSPNDISTTWSSSTDRLSQEMNANSGLYNKKDEKSVSEKRRSNFEKRVETKVHEKVMQIPKALPSKASVEKTQGQRMVSETANIDQISTLDSLKNTLTQGTFNEKVFVEKTTEQFTHSNSNTPSSTAKDLTQNTSLNGISASDSQAENKQSDDKKFISHDDSRSTPSRPFQNRSRNSRYTRGSFNNRRQVNTNSQDKQGKESSSKSLLSTPPLIESDAKAHTSSTTSGNMEGQKKFIAASLGGFLKASASQKNEKEDKELHRNEISAMETKGPKAVETLSTPTTSPSVPPATSDHAASLSTSLPPNKESTLKSESRPGRNYRGRHMNRYGRNRSHQYTPESRLNSQLDCERMSNPPTYRRGAYRRNSRRRSEKSEVINE